MAKGEPNRFLVRLGLVHPNESSREAAKTGLLVHPTLVTHEQLDERLAAIEARLAALEERGSG
jgi:hypothetical protein